MEFTIVHHRCILFCFLQENEEYLILVTQHERVYLLFEWEISLSIEILLPIEVCYQKQRLWCKSNDTSFEEGASVYVEFFFFEMRRKVNLVIHFASRR